MIETIIPLLSAIEKLLSAISKHIVLPSEANQKEIIKHAFELENAYETFQISMNKAQLQLNQGDKTQLREQFMKYGNVIDKQFLDILQNGKQIIQDVALYKMNDLSPLATELQSMGRELLDEWKKLTSTVYFDNPRHFRNYFKFVIMKCEDYKNKAILLSREAVATLRPKIEVASQKIRERFISRQHEISEPEIEDKAGVNHEVNDLIRKKLIGDDLISGLDFQRGYGHNDNTMEAGH